MDDRIVSAPAADATEIDGLIRRHTVSLKGMLADGHALPAVVCSAITAAVMAAEAYGSRHEAVQLIHELLGDLAPSH